MMLQIRRSKERGYADHGWLRSYHTFSFADYYDPSFMGFRSLRVINEDRVEPGRGFQTHAHADMEILSYVLEGSLAHQDSLGNGSTIKPGDVQKMTAGTGVKHSEFNPSPTEWTHFLQIWMLPSEKNLPPSYQQRAFSKEERKNQLCLIASPDAQNSSVIIHQDVKIFSSILDPEQALIYSLPKERYAWIQVASGSIVLNSQQVSQGDGAALTDVKNIEIKSLEPAEILLFDLA